MNLMILADWIFNMRVGVSFGIGINERIIIEIDKSIIF